MDTMKSGLGFLRVAMAAVLAAALAGCGGGGPKAPEFVTVEGTVTVDGAPLQGLTVSFYPDDTRGTKGPMSFGLTDTDGKFKLVGPMSRPGAVPGFHKVTIICPMIGSTPDGSVPKPAAPCNLPPDLASPLTTKQTAEVKAGMAPLSFEIKTRK